jgi:hypothetical protein
MVKGWICLCVAFSFLTTAQGQQKAGSAAIKKQSETKVPDRGFRGYLFTYFTGNGKGEEAVRFALSNDGYHYRALNANKPVIPSVRISSVVQEERS